MDLTPAERQRIYAEEKARLEAQAHLKEANHSKTSAAGVGCAVLLGAILLLGIISQFSSDTKPSAPTNFDAYFYSKEFVKRQLKAPSTAKFCDYEEGSAAARCSCGGVAERHLESWKVREWPENSVRQNGTFELCKPKKREGEKRFRAGF